MVARHLPGASVLDAHRLTSAAPTQYFDNIHVDASTNNALNRDLVQLLYPADHNRPAGLFCAGPPPVKAGATVASENRTDEDPAWAKMGYPPCDRKRCTAFRKHNLPPRPLHEA